MKTALNRTSPQHKHKITLPIKGCHPTSPTTLTAQRLRLRLDFTKEHHSVASGRGLPQVCLETSSTPEREAISDERGANMCRSDHKRTTNKTCLILHACQVCSNCRTPTANSQPKMDTPPSPRHRQLPTNHFTRVQVLLPSGQNSKRTMLPLQKQRQGRRSRRSDEADIGFHPKSRARGWERGRISSMRPPRRKQHPQVLSSPIMSRTYVRSTAHLRRDSSLNTPTIKCGAGAAHLLAGPDSPADTTTRTGLGGSR